MEKHSNNLLIKGLEAKNINFQNGEKSKFNSYSYYQVINAYKPLFVSGVETIDDIYNNINNKIRINEYKASFGITTNTDIFKEICKKICKKYGINYSHTMKNIILKKNISKIDYVHHIYPMDTQYGDFLRMYKFEHELRNMLLKYTLIIEESIKNVFIKRLNNTPEVKANFLSDINNYDTSKGNNDALDTLKLIFEKQKNKYSKPIQRKRKQDITIPYWILINELTMNETYNVIKNLKPEISILIFQDCLNHFTNKKVDLKDKAKTRKQIQTEKGIILSFRTLIKYIGTFRNMLAHNQPIYCYNHKDYSLINYPKMSYDMPWIDMKKNKTLSEMDQQHKINSVTMHDLEIFFGNDKYNANNSSRNINLSFIIYVIYKIISTIDKNTEFYEELIKLYKKYNIILTSNDKQITDTTSIENMIREIETLNMLELDYKEIINKIENSESYKQELKSFIRRFNEQKRKINVLLNKIKIKEIKSKYKQFPAEIRYTDYTGINKKYFEDIK